MNLRHLLRRALAVLSLPVLLVNAASALAASQAINFPQVTGFGWSGGSATLAATASSGLPVTFSLISGSCAISGNTLTATSSGPCKVAADQAGNASFDPAPRLTQDVLIVGGAAQTITFPPVAAFSTNSFATLAATASSGLEVRYTVTAGACAMLSSNTVGSTAAGPCTIEANQEGNNDYGAAPPVSQSITVTAAPLSAQTITFPPIGDRAFSNTSIIFNGVFATSSLSVTLSSLTPGVCAVTGVLTGLFPFPLPPNARWVNSLSTGVCTLRATQEGNANFLPATPVEQSFNITKASQTITFPPIPNQLVGTRFDLSLFGTQADDYQYASSSSRLSVSFISLTPSVCTIGTLIGDAPPRTITKTSVYSSSVGTCTLRATQEGDANFLPATPVEQSFKINLTKASQTITFPPLENQVGLGKFLIKGIFSSSTLPVVLTSLTPTVCLPVGLENFILPLLPPGPRLQGMSNLSYGTCILRASQPGDATFTTAPDVERSFTISAGVQSGLSLAPNIINPRAGTPIMLTALIRGVSPNGVVSFTSTPLSDIVNPTVPVVGCANLSVSMLPAATDSAVATCTTIAEAGARRYTASYSNDVLNQVNAATITTNSPAVGPLDYSDIWWGGAAESGWGMTIAQKGLQQFNAFYVYDADGKPVWYVMSGGSWNADFTRFSGAIYQPTGSSFMNYDARRLQVGAARGNATIAFTDPNNAVFNYTLNGVTAQKNISRLKFGIPDVAPKINVNDIWWAGEAQNGWGVSISQQDRSLFASWYTYDADGKATWLVMSGGKWTGTSYTGELYTTTSSPWLGVPYNTTKFRTQLVGSVTFGFSDASDATMTYTVNGVTQTKTITRLGF